MFVLNPSWEIFFYLFILPSLFYLFIFFSLKVISKDSEHFIGRERETARERERDSPCHYQDGINTE